MSELESPVETGSSQVETQEVNSNQPDSTLESQAQAILELDKVEKFKFGGQEWTSKDLQAAIMRQKDYTQKTQGLAKERESFTGEVKFYENLAWDLMKVKENPALANQFIQTYPQKFHKYLENVVSTRQDATNQSNSGPQVDVNLLSRLDRLEKFHHEQEVSKNERLIEATVSKLSEKYPDAANFKELVLGRAYEAHMKGTEMTEEAWEQIFKKADEEVKDLIKAKYGEMVKKQTQANNKAKDVAPGGGTTGRAPKTFKSFREINEYATPKMVEGLKPA